MAVVLLLLVLSLLLSSSSLASPDVSALLALKRSISLDLSGLFSDWDPAAGSHCNWTGVACDPSSARVAAINLTGTPSFRLAGTLPDDIAALSELRSLSLPHNAFSGKIPVLSGLSRLEVLDLRGNNFSGGIPDKISNLSSLRFLDLAHNSLSGPIPNDLIGMHRLESVDLSFNQLSMTITVSSSCKSLIHLKLSRNFLVDNIPPEIGDCSNLRTLLLNGNILEGRIPDEIGRISGLQVLDVSRNSLTQRIPRELGSCSKLSVLVLTDLVDQPPAGDEFNAFEGTLPLEIFSISNLEIFWAPRANLDGQLPGYMNGSCNLRVLNLAQNYISGLIPEWLGMCRNLTLLDLSSNSFQGWVPSQLGVPCMVYFNVSRNLLSGSLLGLAEKSCRSQDGGLQEEGNLVSRYLWTLLRSARLSTLFRFILEDDYVILHDFSWNNFSGPLPSILLPSDRDFSYGLSVNNNVFNGSLSGEFFQSCRVSSGFAANLSVNKIEGDIGSLLNCPQLRSLEAAGNKLSGPIPPNICNLSMLLHLDLGRNYLNGTIPDRLGELNGVQQVLLGCNRLSGEIPGLLGGMTSLAVLDLSTNYLIGSIPSGLANAINLEAVLLDHNWLTGEIPQSFSMLSRLTRLDFSYNNLTGEIPRLQHFINCDFFKENPLLHPCPGNNALSPSLLPFQTDSLELGGGKGKFKYLTLAAVASASVIVFVLLLLVLALVFGRRRLVRVASIKRKILVTFTDTPTELNYENVVKATGNFSIQNLIGTGGFGATYKAELVPGFLVAVKRLSMGRFQGLQQFDAEIRTLGAIWHKNLVTLVGYHLGEAHTFLIYNYLSGGNLETFIQNISCGGIHWPVIHKIALDVAQALSYLHYSCVPRIVHRDIKPSNILLDEKLNAYLSDFGLARLLEVSETHATTDVAGTFGYVAPEYATTCRVSNKADVYSFGVVLLELMSGKRSLDPSFSEYGNGFTIVSWGRLLIHEERAGELFPPALWETGPKDKLVGMLKLALACTVEDLSVRPSVKQVVETLKRLKN